MEDLFSNSNEASIIRLAGADVSYKSSIPLCADPDFLMCELIKDTPWRQEDVIVWGKKYMQPRLIAWYGDAGRKYKYSSVALDPLPWTERLLAIKKCVESAAETSFNSVLLNYYRDQNDSMGFHSDDEKELGSNPTIASVSLGAERTIIFKHKTEKNIKPIRLILASGSLLLMKGETQKNYKHGISKESQKIGPRINLTFRTILT